jgi:hypothetical protein
MSVITKKIGKGEYAYLAIREGKRVVHRYLGPVGSPKVKQRMAEQAELNMLPKRFHSLFWDTDPGNIHLKEHAAYIIERLLEYGDLDAIAWMQRVYTVQTIIDTLAASRAISEKSKNFWLIWFGADHA